MVYHFLKRLKTHPSETIKALQLLGIDYSDSNENNFGFNFKKELLENVIEYCSTDFLKNYGSFFFRDKNEINSSFFRLYFSNLLYFKDIEKIKVILSFYKIEDIDLFKNKNIVLGLYLIHNYNANDNLLKSIDFQDIENYIIFLIGEMNVQPENISKSLELLSTIFNEINYKYPDFFKKNYLDRLINEILFSSSQDKIGVLLNALINNNYEYLYNDLLSDKLREEFYYQSNNELEDEHPMIDKKIISLYNIDNIKHITDFLLFLKSSSICLFIFTLSKRDSFYSHDYIILVLNQLKEKTKIKGKIVIKEENNVIKKRL